MDPRHVTDSGKPLVAASPWPLDERVSTPSTPIVETDRDELRREIQAALRRFVDVARNADPAAPVPGSSWTAGDVVAHVLTVVHRYAALTRGEEFERADDPRALGELNQSKLDAVEGTVDENLAEIEQHQPALDAWFDRVDGDPQGMPFHGGIHVSGRAAQVNWLSELLFHGSDIAAAAKVPWKPSDRAWTLLLLLMQEVGPAYLRRDLPPGTDLMVEMRVRGANPSLWHVHDGGLDIRQRTSSDRPDAVLRGPADVVAAVLYQRMPPLTAARKGLLVTGGRRPWRALGMPKLFVSP
jgi:hypothetical protein